MKVEFLLTIRCSPEDRNEAIHHFGSVYQKFREQVDASIEAGLPIAVQPQNTQIRWLLNTPRFE